MKSKVFYYELFIEVAPQVESKLQHVLQGRKFLIVGRKDPKSVKHKDGSITYKSDVSLQVVSFADEITQSDFSRILSIGKIVSFRTRSITGDDTCIIRTFMQLEYARSLMEGVQDDKKCN